MLDAGQLLARSEFVAAVDAEIRVLPPAAAQGDEQLRAVHIALCGRPRIAQARLLVAALGVDQSQDIALAGGVADALQLQRCRGRVERLALGIDQGGIVTERAQRVGHLAEGLQYRLPVGASDARKPSIGLRRCALSAPP